MDDELIVKAREKFERAADAWSDNLEAGRDDVRFGRLGEQWDDKVKRMRDDEGRPCLTHNHMNAFLRKVVNDARMNRPAITVHPADSNADVETAEILSGLIRNIEVVSNADVAYDTAVADAAAAAFGYWRVNTAQTSDDSFDQDITIEKIADAFRVYPDPDSEASDSSDWNCCFIVKWLTKDEFARAYKGKEKVDWDAQGYTQLETPWRNGDDIMVAEYWHREEVDKPIVTLSNETVVTLEEYESKGLAEAGLEIVGEPRTIKGHKVTQYILSGAEVLETVEWPGKYIPIIPVYGDEVWVDGKRHLRSLIRDAKDAQREYNYWRTTATEMIALAPKVPYIGPKGAFDTDVGKWSTANNQSHAFIEYDGPERPMREPMPQIPAAAMQQSVAANEDMKAIIGLHDPSLGIRQGNSSGVAIREMKHAGDVSTFHFLDNLTRGIRHCGRVLLDLIPRVYSTARILRVLGQDMQPQTVQIAPQEQHQQMMLQAMQRGQEIARIFDISAGKYDLTVKAGPSFNSQREETRAELVEIIRSAPESAKILGPMYLRNSDWPGADEAADMMEQAGAPPPQQQAQGIPPELQQQVMQMQQELQRLTQENDQLKADRQLEQQKMMMVDVPKNQAAQTKAQADLIRANADMAKARMAATNPYGIEQH